MALGTPENDQRGFRDPGYGLRMIVVCALSIALMIADSFLRSNACEKLLSPIW